MQQQIDAFSNLTHFDKPHVPTRLNLHCAQHVCPHYTNVNLSLLCLLLMALSAIAEARVPVIFLRFLIVKKSPIENTERLKIPQALQDQKFWSEVSNTVHKRS